MKFINIKLYALLLTFISFDLVKSIHNQVQGEVHTENQIEPTKNQNWIQRNPKKFIALAALALLTTGIIIGVGIGRLTSKKPEDNDKSKNAKPTDSQKPNITAEDGNKSGKSNASDNEPSQTLVLSSNKEREAKAKAIAEEYENLENEYISVFPPIDEGTRSKSNRRQGTLRWVNPFISDKGIWDIIGFKVQKFLDKEDLARDKVVPAYSWTANENNIYLNLINDKSGSLLQANVTGLFTKQQIEDIKNDLRFELNSIKAPEGNAEVPEALLNKLLLIRLKTESLLRK